jgi:hypothetical protein
MKTAARLVLICAALTAPGAALARPPVVVELFTAQGCSSCGKANVLVDKLADQPGVVALTWPVDYWDYLGWKDTFARPEFTDRQRAYERRFGVRDVYTPQVVVDGLAQASGAKGDVVERLVRDARHAASDPPDMKFLPGARVAVGSSRVRRPVGEVWLIRFDPREQEVEVKDGDNRGQTVVHRNVVRQAVRLGAWRGRPVIFKLPPADEDGLATLVLLQGAKSGRVLGVLATPVAKPPQTRTPAAGGG